MIWPFGEGPVGAWLERRRALRDVQRIDALEAAALAIREDNPLNRAKVSAELDDRKSAREFLDLARKQIPRHVLTSPDTVGILLRLGDFAELESFAVAGAKRFPNQPHYLVGYALAAERQRNFDEAIRRWAVVRKKFPNDKPGYVHAIGCLRQTKRLDEAEALLRTAMRKTPEDLLLRIEQCWLAEARGDWATAYARWDSLRSRHRVGYDGAAQALQKLDRTAEAEALLEEGRVRYPTYPDIAIMQARIAEQTGNTAEALKRWAVVRERFPFERSGYTNPIRLLREQQEWVAADAIALAAIRRFPSDAEPLADYANLAHARQDWAEAAKRWAALRTAFPDRKDAQKEAQALAASGVHAAGAAEPRQTA
jgi:tetratricopeptide (TPR) repeat protein